MRVRFYKSWDIRCLPMWKNRYQAWARRDEKHKHLTGGELLAFSAWQKRLCVMHGGTW